MSASNEQLTKFPTMGKLTIDESAMKKAGVSREDRFKSVVTAHAINGMTKLIHIYYAHGDINPRVLKRVKLLVDGAMESLKQQTRTVVGNQANPVASAVHNLALAIDTLDNACTLSLVAANVVAGVKENILKTTYGYLGHPGSMFLQVENPKELKMPKSFS